MLRGPVELKGLACNVKGQIGGSREAAVKAYRYGAMVDVSSTGNGWIGSVLHRVGGNVLHATAPQPTEAQARGLATRWADGQAQKQVDEWIDEHGTAERVLRKIGNGDPSDAYQRAAAQAVEEGAEIVVPPCGLRGDAW